MKIKVEREVQRLQITPVATYHVQPWDYVSRYDIVYYKDENTKVTTSLNVELNPFQLRTELQKFINEIGAANA